MNNKSTLVFTGDIGFDRYMDGKWDDETLLSNEIIEYLNSADHVIANVEGPLVRQATNTTLNGTAQLLHTMNPDATKVLRKMNADIWNICNNHIMDAGEDGMRCTLKEASLFGAKTLGAGMNIGEAMAPVYIDEAGGIGLVGVGYRRGCKPAGEEKAGCLNWNEMELIQKSIDEVRSKCKWCIIVSHGGEEFTPLPSPYTRDRYHEFLKMGADIVVSHHPHVPMNYEWVGDKIIFYSLGNFIFDTDYQRAQFNTEKGILLKLMFSEEQFSFDAMGIVIDREYEKVVKGDLPKIFEDVPPKEYELLAPFSARAFIANTKRQQIYLNKDEWSNASEEKWREHFANPKRSGRVEGEGLDFFIICPLAEEESKKEWTKSKLKGVVEYIKEQL